MSKRRFGFVPCTPFASGVVTTQPKATCTRSLRCSTEGGSVNAVQIPRTIESTRAYLAAARPAPVEQERLEAMLGIPMAPADAMLLLAARLGDVATMEKLLALDSAPDVNVQDTEGSTAAMRAASRGHVECLKLLLKTGKLDIMRTNNWNYDLNIYVGSVKNSYPVAYEEMIRLLSDYGVYDPRAGAEKRWTQKPSKKSSK